MRAVLWLVVVVVAIGVGAYFGFQLAHAGRPAFWLITGAPTVALAIVAAIRARRDEELGEWLKPKWGDFTRAFVSAGALFAGAFMAARLLAPLGSQVWLLRVYVQIGEEQELQAHAAWVALVVIVFALAEELVWRGLVTSVLAELVGSRWAWIWAAALYALAHVPTMWSLASPGLDPLLPIAALGCGLVWGAMARFTGRLAPGIVSHALFDWCVIMMFPLAKMGS
jgi:hypothetical protein